MHPGPWKKEIWYYATICITCTPVSPAGSVMDYHNYGSRKGEDAGAHPGFEEGGAQ